ncbi:DMT family transporter [Devosia algicola]|uniref:DMT family transporter n=1 Tax=Devosia algicola TaxID=3026418 RepID=A0ABY7YPY4_9HYPH|nr:DMT family transporter [Devosia algicola]WDR03380.1 DMT family transporter [Devosia algicola]
MSVRDWLLIIFIGSIWGCSFLFNAVLIRELGPIWVSAGRVSIAAIASWLALMAMKKPVPRDPALIGKLMLLGVFSYAIPFTLFPLGQQVIPSGLTAIINALTPIMTVIVSNFWPGGEKASTNKSFGVLAGFAGAALIAWPALSAGGTTRLWGIAACLMATILYAITLNVARSFKAVEPTVLATIALTGASIAAVPVALVGEGIPHITHIETWAAWLALGLISTALAFQIMYRLLPRIGATNFASNTFIAPVVAILLGVTLLGETLQPSHYLGMAAIFVGLLLIDGRIVRRWQRAST